MVIFVDAAWEQNQDHQPYLAGLGFFIRVPGNTHCSQLFICQGYFSSWGRSINLVIGDQNSTASTNTGTTYAHLKVDIITGLPFFPPLPNCSWPWRRHKNTPSFRCPASTPSTRSCRHARPVRPPHSPYLRHWRAFASATNWLPRRRPSPAGISHASFSSRPLASARGI